MRAVIVEQPGGPEALTLVERETPEPGPGEVRVRLTHRSVNPADLSMVRGTYGRSRDLPAVGGNEGAGRIDAVGEGVEAGRLGQRVVKLGEAPTWQERVVLPADQTVPVPDTLSDEAAACSRIRQLPIAALLAETIRRVSCDESVSTLYVD